MDGPNPRPRLRQNYNGAFAFVTVMHSTLQMFPLCSGATCITCTALRLCLLCAEHR